MGTVVSLAVPVDDVPDATLDTATAAVENLFAGLDETFSLYRTGSEASRLARGEITLRKASAQMRNRYAESVSWRLLTEGTFSPERPDGVADLSGIVKGYAVRIAGETLLARGIENWCLNAGGDVLVSGSPAPDGSVFSSARTSAPWLAGIVDPEDRGALLTTLALGGPGPRCALASSGSAERGDHIWTPGRGRPEFSQVSVAAADIVTADVLATAIVAGGEPMLHRAAERWDIDILVVRRDGELLATPGFRSRRP